MLEVADAREIVLRHAVALSAEVAALTPPPLGRVLAEAVRADLDSPPFDKAMMDGYAVRAADCSAGPVELRVTGEVAAGAVPNHPVGPGEAVAVYTGAPMPAGADAVVMKERCEVLSEGRVRVTDPKLTPRKNVLDRGREMLASDVVLPIGAVLSPAAVGLLATVGRTTTALVPVPVVGVLATGNELVEADRVPGPGQIRNSNGPMLAAQVARAGATPRLLGIAPDDAGRLRDTVSDALASCDVLLLAGGVSVGLYDLVPGVLADLGVQTHFHKVRMKPGKPLLFGTLGDKLVFGLPGNPVGAFVAFELFVRPALQKLAGHVDDHAEPLRLLLAEAFASVNDRPTFHPAKLEDGGSRVRALPWFGSADLRGLTAADALIVLPPGDVRYAAGEAVAVMRV